MDADDEFRRDWPRAAEDAWREAYRASLWPATIRCGRKLLIVLYAYNGVAGTIDVHAGTLTFPDCSKPVVRDVHPQDAVAMCWAEVRRSDPPNEPWENSWSDPPFRIVCYQKVAA